MRLLRNEQQEQLLPSSMMRQTSAPTLSIRSNNNKDPSCFDEGNKSVDF